MKALLMLCLMLVCISGVKLGGALNGQKMSEIVEKKDYQGNLVVDLKAPSKIPKPSNQKAVSSNRMLLSVASSSGTSPYTVMAQSATATLESGDTSVTFSLQNEWLDSANNNQIDVVNNSSSSINFVAKTTYSFAGGLPDYDRTEISGTTIACYQGSINTNCDGGVLASGDTGTIKVWTSDSVSTVRFIIVEITVSPIPQSSGGTTDQSDGLGAGVVVAIIMTILIFLIFIGAGVVYLVKHITNRRKEGTARTHQINNPTEEEKSSMNQDDEMNRA
jgi:hypothetical protein